MSNKAINKSLKNLIKTVCSSLRIKKSRITKPDFENKIGEFQTKLEEHIKELNGLGNHRIYSEKEGGVILGPMDKRKKELHPNYPKKVTCQTGNLKGKKKSFEVPYFRAVFNDRSRIKIDKLNEDKPEYISLIGYESPLLRQNKQQKLYNCKCDLVGITPPPTTPPQKVICIEGKVNPKSYSTDIVFGLLESFAYGYFANYIYSKHKDDFIKEVKASIDYFEKYKIPIEENLDIAFCLAAPKDYFKAYFLNNNKSKKRKEEAEKILEVFSKFESPKWLGFLVLEPDLKIKDTKPTCFAKIDETRFKPSKSTKKDDEFFIPSFNTELKAKLAKNMVELEDALK